MAAGPTYEPIAKTTLAIAANSYTFSSIPATYTDLVLIYAIKGATGGVTDYNIRAQVNSDTATNYSYTLLTGSGTTAGSARGSTVNNILLQGSGYLSTTIISNGTINFNNYSNTTTYKTILSKNNQSNAAVNATVGLWRNTGAINAIKIYLDAGNFGKESTFTLYGIAAA